MEWPDGTIWVIGGLTASASTGTFAAPDTTIFEFNMAEQAWYDTGLSLPSSAGMGVTAILNDGDTLLVTCGFLTSAVCNTTMYTLKRSTRTWTNRGTFPASIYAPNWVVRANGGVRVICGRDSITTESNNIVREINTITWAVTTVNPAPTPSAADPCFYRGQCELNDGRLLLVGGHYSGVQPSIEIYDPEGAGGLGTFTNLGNLPAGRRISAISSRQYNGFVYAFAGEDSGNAATTSVYKINITSGAVTTETALGSASFGGAAWTSLTGLSYILGSSTPANKIIQTYQQT